MQPLVYRGLDGLAGSFAAMRVRRAEALVAIAAHVIDEARSPLAQLALRDRLPTISRSGSTPRPAVYGRGICQSRSDGGN